jgi:hypothetical protein
MTRCAEIGALSSGFGAVSGTAAPFVMALPSFTQNRELFHWHGAKRRSGGRLDRLDA